MREASPGLGPAACLSWSDAEKLGLLSDECGDRPAGRLGKPAPISCSHLPEFQAEPALREGRQSLALCVAWAPARGQELVAMTATASFRRRRANLWSLLGELETA